MEAGRDIICISSIDWDFLWQGHQQIMSTLAAQGHRVLFIDNTGVRPPTVRDFPRLRSRLRNWRRGTKGFREESQNLFVYSPLVVPLPYSRVARWFNSRLILRALRRWMRAIGFGRPVLWTFLPTPLASDLIRGLEPAAVVYYCIDDFASSSTAARRVARSEARLLGEADLVFVTSEKLRERAARYTSRVHFFPFGVDLAAFDAVRESDGEMPADLAKLPRPVVGYVGGLHQWVDQELVAAVAARLPEMTFALLGPAQNDVSTLTRCPNVTLLGPRAHADVPRYIKGFDVGLIPYRLTDYTANVYPTKLNEYLAMGVPVVATDLPEIRRFDAEQGGVLAIASGADEFAAALRDAAAKQSPADVERRVDVARQNSWETRIARMTALVEDVLAEKQALRERWDKVLHRLYRSARRRLLEPAITIIAFYLIVFQTPLVWLLAAPLRMEAPPRAADAIVVFAGGVGESGKAGAGYQERVKQAVALYHDGRAPWVVFSSGYAFAFPEAEVMRDLAVSHGVPRERILLETAAANTYENVRFVHRILSERGWRQALLVTSPYHVRRALLTWRRAAPDVALVPAPVPVNESQFYAHGRGISVEQIQAIVHEYAAIGLYWWRGWI